MRKIISVSKGFFRGRDRGGVDILLDLWWENSGQQVLFGSAGPLSRECDVRLNSGTALKQKHNNPGAELGGVKVAKLNRKRASQEDELSLREAKVGRYDNLDNLDNLDSLIKAIKALSVSTN